MKIGVSLPVREMKDDLLAIRDYAQKAEDLGYTHLRVPDQILRPDSGYLHEPMMMLAYIAAITTTIELVPSVIILPARQTVHFAKQAAQLEVLSGGRVRIGIGVGGSEDEYKYLGKDFHNRGERCNEQMDLLKALWTKEEVSFNGKHEQVNGAGLDPLPTTRPIPMWIGARPIPSAPVIERIALKSDGWFVLCSPEEYPAVRDQIFTLAENAGRTSEELGQEAGIAVVGPREAEWQARVTRWRNLGLSHLCLRTLGGGLSPRQHLEKLEQIVPMIPD